MADQHQYLTPGDISKLGTKVTIKAVEAEFVDGRMRLVVYFKEKKKGLLLTRELAEDISKIWGRSKMVDEFFASEGQLH